uniref:DNA/RNA non-specific endonuclease/pyrophosphatase/phosphodiesterase domain-containing protein n=1 Tax=Heliothis virescens TaxID=7102 RepID=A0A2A4JKE1_HELVI
MSIIQRAFLLILCALNIQRGQKCRLNTRTHFGEPLPVIVRDNKLLEPTDKFGNIDMDYGDILTLSCEGTGNILHPNAQHELPVATISCEGGDMFKNEVWLNSPARFSLFKCNYPPRYVSKRTERLCYDGNPIIEVGYTIRNDFYPLYESCFNEAGFSAIYSKYTQKPYNALYQTKIVRPFFIADSHFGYIPVDSLFSPAGQKGAVAQLVGSAIDTYVTKTEFLSRGHLAAKTDFPLAFGERATFHYVNCAPQWVGFNGGNWNTLEVDLRNHIHIAGYSTIIYTGVFGLAQLNNEMGRKVDLYLYNDENNNPVIPVPLFFYKVVYEPSRKCGIAFVGINNPYYTVEEARQMFFCKDLCRADRAFPWLTWHPDNPSEGYTFCCTVSDFKKTVPHLPPFEVDCLLT